VICVVVSCDFIELDATHALISNTHKDRECIFIVARSTQQRQKIVHIDLLTIVKMGSAFAVISLGCIHSSYGVKIFSSALAVRGGKITRAMSLHTHLERPILESSNDKHNQCVDYSLLKT